MKSLSLSPPMQFRGTAIEKPCPQPTYCSKSINTNAIPIETFLTMSNKPIFEWESLFDDEEDEAPPPATETEALPPAPETEALPADEFPAFGGEEDEVFDYFLAYEPRERGAGNEEGNSGRTLFRCSHCNLFVAGTLQEHIRSGSGCPDNEELRVRLEESSKRGGAISRDQGMHSHSFDLTHVLGKGWFDPKNREGSCTSLFLV